MIKKFWNQYKQFRNESNNAIKEAKRKYFKDNLDANKKDPQKTWKLVNELTSSKQTEHRIAEILSFQFTFHKRRAKFGIGNCSYTNIVPEAFVTPTNIVFSLQNNNVNKVCKLLKMLDAKKATALDKIPSKPLKLATDIVSPSLTHIYNESMRIYIYICLIFKEPACKGPPVDTSPRQMPRQDTRQSRLRQVGKRM